MIGARIAATAAAAAALALGARAAAAQGRGSLALQPSGRVDVLASRIRAVQAGVGLDARAGRYVRLGLVGAAGESWYAGRSGLSARIEAVGRFVLDPEFATRWAPYITGGIGARYDRVGSWRGVLSAGIGLEGPNANGVVPFVEVGYGGGLRLGIGLRRALTGSR